MSLAFHSNTSREERLVFLSDLGREQADTIILASTNVDSDGGHTPTDEFRKGNVVVMKTSDGEFVEANDAAGDRSTPASITSVGHVDSDNATFKLVGNHGTITVSITSNAGSEADWVTDLNADAAFKAHYIASVSGTDVKVESRNVGEEEWFYVHTDTTAGAGFAEGEANAVKGATADYRVTGHMAKLVNGAGAAIDQEVLAYKFGHFKESELINLTKEARAVLVQRGSLFE